jgi:hypothetical protein
VQPASDTSDEAIQLGEHQIFRCRTTPFSSISPSGRNGVARIG